ncbi:hypothetical protein Ancab_018347 [Ancistrocladus abbreviatus]
MDTTRKSWQRQAATRVTIFSQFFGVLNLVLMLIWLLHYRGGINIASDNPYLVWNAHPLFMSVGFVYFAGEAIMAYLTLGGVQKVQKRVHAAFHLVAMAFWVAGIIAAFKFHRLAKLPNLYTPHSWLGLTTFTLYVIQWLFGLYIFGIAKPGAVNLEKVVPWHVCIGRVLLYMAVCTAETGLIQVFIKLGLRENPEAHLINFIALSILLFGVTVDLSVGFSRLRSIDKV